MAELGEQLKGARLTTAEILYHMPDHPHLLQSFIWQFMDRAPRYPKLTEFLIFWKFNIDGPIHSVKVAGGQIIKPAGLLHVGDAGYLH
jgi:uncharacterized protein Usg